MSSKQEVAAPTPAIAPAAKEPIDAVEASLAKAIEGATEAKEWATVAQLAGELTARREARAGDVPLVHGRVIGKSEQAKLQLVSTTADAGGAAPLGPDARFRADQAAQRAEEDARPLHPIDHYPCHSPTTGAYFVARVTRKFRDGVPDVRFPDGQIVDLLDYTPSPEFIAKIPPKLEGQARAHWIWESRLNDMRLYVGKGASALLTARNDLKEKLAALETQAREAAPAATVAK
jgi:hypothetical protein